MVTVAISQPMYFPWPGFFEMMKLADIFVWLDDVQFSKGSFTNRVQVKTESGWTWMTIPIASRSSAQIHELQSRGETWRQSHRSLLVNSLQNYSHFSDAMDIFDSAVAASQLVEVLISSCELQASALGALPGKIVRIKSLDISGSSWQRLIQIIQRLNGTRYVSGLGGLKYIDHDAFEEHGIAVEYMNYNIKPWNQRNGKFSPYVTSLDLIAAEGTNAGAFLQPESVSWRLKMGSAQMD